MGNTHEELSVGYLSTDVGVGEAANGTHVVEYGDCGTHVTVLKINTTLGAIAGGAALALGKKLYTFPEGAVVVTGSSMSVAITQTDGNITADTPDVGLGTTLASGAVSVLGGTAAFENILTGQTAADCDGTATVKTVVPGLVIESAGGHSVYLNVADLWAASGDAAAELTGTVVLSWVRLSE